MGSRRRVDTHLRLTPTAKRSPLFSGKETSVLLGTSGKRKREKERTLDIPMQLPFAVQVLQSLEQLPHDDRDVLLPEHSGLEEVSA